MFPKSVKFNSTASGKNGAKNELAVGEKSRPWKRSYDKRGASD